jgi:putative phosphoesterase
MASEIRRIGFLADTHSRKADGSDLPQQVLDAFAGVDLIVHLGDIGQKGILERLRGVAPVLVPAGDNKGYVPFDAAGEAPLKTIESGDVSIGLTFNLTQPDKKIAIDEAGAPVPEGPLEPLLVKRFGKSVGVVAFAGTHRQHLEEQDGVLFVNPGSPTLPADKRGESDLGSVALLNLADGRPSVELVRLTRG